MDNVQEKSANAKEMPKRNFPVVPTTKILAIGQFTKPPTPEQIKEIFPKEVPATHVLPVKLSDPVGNVGGESCHVPADRPRQNLQNLGTCWGQEKSVWGWSRSC